MPTLTSLPAALDLAFYQGDEFYRIFTFQDSNDDPIDLTGYVPSAQIRAKKAETGTLLATFTAELVDADAGTVSIRLTTEQTTGLKSGFWDLQLELDGVVRTYVAGKVTITAQVTHDDE